MDDSLAATLRTRLAQALTSPWASEAVTDWSALSLGNAEVPQGAAEQASPMLASVGQLAPPSPLAAATAGESVPGAPTGPGGGAGGAAATPSMQLGVNPDALSNWSREEVDTLNGLQGQARGRPSLSRAHPRRTCPPRPPRRAAPRLRTRTR